MPSPFRASIVVRSLVGASLVPDTFIIYQRFSPSFANPFESSRNKANHIGRIQYMPEDRAAIMRPTIFPL
ncbi:MAG: hypothetical protein C4334_12080 [Pyrinomonas sp.]